MRHAACIAAHLVGLTGLILMLPSAQADAPSSANAVSATATQENEDLEPSLAGVTVEAHRLKLGKLKVLINQSVDKFYDAFNKANTEPGYTTTCSDERGAQSYIQSHVCTPQFVHAATQDEVQGFMYGYAAIPAANMILLRMPAYKKRIRELIHSDANVRRAAFEFDALTQRYAAVNHEKVLGK